MKILIIDDEESILNLIRLELELEGFEVFTATSGQETIQILQQEKNPDAIILDIMLPDIDGFTLLQKIRSQIPNVPILMLTAKNQINDKIIGLQLGADDYMTKPFNHIELVLRLKNILKRVKKNTDVQKQPLQIKAGNITIIEKERKVLVNNKELQLTYREFDLLCLLIKNKKRVFTRDELLQTIWGFEFTGNTRAVDIMIQRLRKKIGDDSKWIKTVYGVGYKFDK
ncbi:response regulator transcription factor [Heyndrickxia coagulans]|uniref:response regulator transcription factor n=1 Tax=Heyndrickxia coagulans TaxID=1398 RepID=UPI003D22865B